MRSPAGCRRGRLDHGVFALLGDQARLVLGGALGPLCLAFSELGVAFAIDLRREQADLLGGKGEFLRGTPVLLAQRVDLAFGLAGELDLLVELLTELLGFDRCRVVAAGEADCEHHQGGEADCADLGNEHGRLLLEFDR